MEPDDGVPFYHPRASANTTRSVVQHPFLPYTKNRSPQSSQRPSLVEGFATLTYPSRSIAPGKLRAMVFIGRLVSSHSLIAFVSQLLCTYSGHSSESKAREKCLSMRPNHCFLSNRTSLGLRRLTGLACLGSNGSNISADPPSLHAIAVHRCFSAGFVFHESF